MVHQQFWKRAAAAAASTPRSLPVFIAAATSSLHRRQQQHEVDGGSRTAYCSAAAPAPDPAAAAPPPPPHHHHHIGVMDENKEEGFRPKEEGFYADLFPKRQLWQPKLEYPQWDLNWDGRHPAPTGDQEEDRRHLREIRKHGITRHVILIRHGQYDETHKEDERRTLTPLGRRQAELTGRRLAEMIMMQTAAAAHGGAGPVRVKALRVSGMARAKETAEIIAKYLPGVELAEPDPLLSEGRPCHHIPGIRATEKSIHLTDEHHPRIEQAYQKYFYRSLEIPDKVPKQEDAVAAAVAAVKPDPDHHYLPDSGGGGVTTTRIITGPTTTTPGAAVANVATADNVQHEFEIIVCHANVIRYFLCRALQLPPEAWLRYCPFNCSMTYITIRPSGNVSCRMMGDIGHLPYEESTFSKHHGFNW